MAADSVFHLAFHVRDLDEAKRFYGDILGCPQGRSTDTWVDFNFFGHQISLHLGEPFAHTLTGLVGSQRVPMPHLGVVLELTRWKLLAERLEEQGLEFIMAPQIRFAGQPGEQWTMFFMDPSGNPIEVKGFVSLNGLFDC